MKHLKKSKKITKVEEVVPEVDEVMDIDIEVEADKTIEGLGDVIRAVTEAVGIKPCDDCEERRKKLNRMFSFLRAVKRDITSEEIEFLNGIGRTVTGDDRMELGRIYTEVFGTKVNHCNCPALYKSILDKLRTQVEYQSIE